MAITTTEYANFANKAFFDNREWLNQENWQMYFGGSLPSGVLVKGKLESSGVDYTSALARQVLSASYIQFRAGAVMANGIYASYSGGTSIPVIKSGDIDRLFVVRVFVSAGNVKIVGMTKVAAEYGYTPSVFAKMLLQDESLACTRNSSYYDIPLLYEIFGGDVYDLRRLIYLPSQAPDVDISFSHDDVTNTDTVPGVMYGRDFLQIYGGMNYNLTFASADTATSFYVYPNPACSEKHAIVRLANNSAVTKQIRIPLLWKSLPFTYSWLESWDADPNNRYLYKDIVSGDKLTLIFTPNGHDTSFAYTVTNKSSATGGGGIDPDDYFTKQEIAAQMLLKANVSDMEAALALKEDIANLGTLAYQNQADYVTQLINKPTLGALSSKDQANLSTDVEGILPIVNGGTGANTLAGIIASIFGNETTYYVDNVNGDDANDGTTYAKAFRTIQHAIDSSPMFAESTLILESGTYAENIVIPFGRIIKITPYRTSASITISPSQSMVKAVWVKGGKLSCSGSYNLTVTGTSAQSLVTVEDGGQLISDVNLSVINTYNTSSDNYFCIGISKNSYAYFSKSVSLNNQTGHCMLVSYGSQVNSFSLGISGKLGIRCFGAIINIQTITCTTTDKALIVDAGGVITFKEGSGVGTDKRSVSGGGCINYGN